MKTNIAYILVLIFAGLFLYQVACNKPAPVQLPPKISTTVVYDTVIVHDTVPGKTKIIKSTPDTTWRDSIQYVPDTNYNRLLEQYDRLGDRLFSRNIYQTKYKLGSYGTATVTDTVNANKLVGTSMMYDIKVPEKTITTTITQQAKPVNQVYVGGGFPLSRTNLIEGYEVGVILKNKKDQIFQVKVIQIQQLPVMGSVGAYFKLKF